MKIDPGQFYTPKDIVGLGIMSANTPDTQRQMLLRYIRQKRIKATNLGGPKKPRYVIHGKDLIEYANTQIKPGEYTQK